MGKLYINSFLATPTHTHNHVRFLHGIKFSSKNDVDLQMFSPGKSHWQESSEGVTEKIILLEEIKYPKSIRLPVHLPLPEYFSYNTTKRYSPGKSYSNSNSTMHIILLLESEYDRLARASLRNMLQEQVREESREKTIFLWNSKIILCRKK